jgi:pimeloyl-ACP methyl ester carboxylesterase
MTAFFSRRAALLSMAAALLAGCASKPEPIDPTPPIVFVHGQGDSAAVWTTTIWRFESNGWPRERLYAVDFPYPTARDDDTMPQDGRSSTTEQRLQLAAEIDKVLAATGARKVVLFALSRGGYAVRGYLQENSGAAKVSHAILGGTQNHGVYASARLNPNSEFNGAGPFLAALNAPKGPNGDEVGAAVRWMTIRSDNNDRYAQSEGARTGLPGFTGPTGVSFEGPALRGAENVVIAGIDHRETALGPKAFEQAYRFITGGPPARTGVVPETRVVLDGKLSGLGLNNEPGKGNDASNLPLAGASIEVYATNPVTGERLGPALHRKVVGADGRWGPFNGDSTTRYEFVVTAPGYAVTHVYRSPFARSSSVVQLRAERIANADRDARAVVTLTRPRGYFGIPRDEIMLDDRSPPAGIVPGVPVTSSVKLKLLDAPGRAVPAEFNGERIVGRAWPAAENHVTFLELTN